MHRIEADVISDLALTDNSVKSSLERLILELRGESPALTSGPSSVSAGDEPANDIVIDSIRRIWRIKVRYPSAKT